jgi:16S rRNA (cytidine1402-2'-O)-methyltransferase
LLTAVAGLPLALVIYEAPHRLARTVADLADALGGSRTVVVAREITKKFEAITRMPLADVTAWLDADANRSRGEFVLLIDALSDSSRDDAEAALSLDVDRLLRAVAAELPPTRAARVAADATGIARDALYARIRSLKLDVD